MNKHSESPGKSSLQPTTDTRGTTLYELPNCSICLSELTENLTNLSCGHVFHVECIFKHFSYRTTCPNCQKRAHNTEMRPVYLKFHANTETRFHQLLNQIGSNDRGPFEEVTNKLKASLEQQQILKSQNIEFKKRVQSLSETESKNKKEIETMTKDNTKLTRDVIVLNKALEERNREIYMVSTELQDQRDKNAAFEALKSQFEQLRKVKQAMGYDADLVAQKKKDFQNRGLYEEGMDYFFQMAMMSRMEYRQNRKQNANYIERLRQADQQNRTHKRQIESFRLQIKKGKEEQQKIRERADRYKQKCIQLMQKLKAIAPDSDRTIHEFNDNSIGFEAIMEENKLAKRSSTSMFSEAVPKPTVQKKEGPTLTEQIGIYGGLHSKKSLSMLPTRTMFK